MRTTRKCWRLCTAFAAVFALSCLLAAIVSAADSAAAQTTSVSGFSVDAGYMNTFGDTGEGTLYYRLDYRGATRARKGEPFSLSEAEKPPKLPELQDPGDDLQSIAIRITGGGADLKSGTFDFLGIKSIRFPATKLGDIRGGAQFSGRIDGKETNAALAIESPPLRIIPGKISGYATNWLIVGLAGENRTGSAVGGDNRWFGPTYRAFIGQAWEWIHTEQQTREREALLEEIHKVAPTRPDRADLKKSPISEASQLAQYTIRSLLDLTAAPDWPVDEAVTNLYKSPDRPTTMLWLEGSGWYSATGALENRRLNNLITVTFTRYLNPATDNPMWIRLRYENGRARAAPTVARNFLAVLVGGEF